MFKNLTAPAVFSVSLVMSAMTAQAEDLLSREVLQTKPLSGSEHMEVIVSRLVLKPGGRVPLHTHAGDEHAVVIKGGKVSLPNGKEIVFQDGTPLFFPAGQAHGGVTNLDDEDMIVMTTHVVDAREPFSTPAE